MAQIFVFTKRIEFKTLMEIECKTMTGVPPIIRQKDDDCKSTIDLLESLEMIVVDDPSPELVKILKEQEAKIKGLVVLAGQDHGLKFSKTFAVANVEDCLNHLKGIYSKALGAGSEEGYISIPVGSLVHFKVLPLDLFVKLSDDKYVKRIPAHEEIDGSTIKGFEAKGVTELYFEKKHNRDFTMMLLNNMINKVEKVYTNVDEKFKASNEVFHTTREIVSKMGFPPRILEVCETVVNRITEDVKKEKGKVGEYLNQLRTNNDLGFRYRFAELTSFISTQIVEGIPNLGDDRVKKIVFCSLFCDVSLKDRSHIHVRKPEDMAKLSPEDQKDISEHAFKAAEIVAKSKNAPMEAEKIIKQHHGAITGMGFPKVAEMSPQLAPLAKCLITAQEIAYAVLIEPNSKPLDVIAKLKDTHKGTILEEYLVLFEKNAKGL